MACDYVRNVRAPHSEKIILIYGGATESAIYGLVRRIKGSDISTTRSRSMDIRASWVGVYVRKRLRVQSTVTRLLLHET
jgi:hypothetical protein